MKIRTKVFLIVLPVMAGLSVLIYVLFTAQLRREALREVEVRASAIAEMTAYSLSTALYFNDAESIREDLDTARHNTDVVYAVVADAKGKEIEAVERKAAETAGYKGPATPQVSPGGRVRFISVPLTQKGETIGRLDMGFSLASYQRAVRAARRTTLITAGVIFALAIAAVMLVGLLLTRPLVKITGTADEIAAGDLTKRAPVLSGDEIGRLARAFNSMVDRLQGIYVQLDQAKRSLEDRVRDRTSELQSEVEERRRAEDALREANVRLQTSVEAVELRNRELQFLGEIGEGLQACNSEAEIYAVIRPFAPRLFEEQSGILYVFQESRHLFDPVLSWGDPPAADASLDPADCWALRRGKSYRVSDLGRELVCAHVARSTRPLRGYICSPLTAHGDTIGLLYLACDGSPDHGGPDGEACGELIQRLAANLALRVAMAIANVRLRATLREQSIRDPLTGLFNRRYMEETLDRELHRAIRADASLAVLMLDIDHFKSFNDSFGHEAGDALLRDLGALLQGQIRREDVACRYGGEEFTLILPGLSQAAAVERSWALIRRAAELRVEAGGRILGPISLSIGVATFPDHAAGGAALIKAADEALLEAKRAGRGRVVVAPQGDPLKGRR